MRILFQGDSITDAGRDKSDPHSLAGYTALVAENLSGFKNIEFVNLGISGNRTIDLVERYESDFAAVKPDIVTILIGVNDVWRGIDSGLYTSPDEFEANYRRILTGIKEDTGAKIIIMEPFVLPVEERLHFREALLPLLEVVRKLALELADGFINLDGIFYRECMNCQPEDLAGDGIHPSVKGQKLIAEYLTEEIKRFL